MCPFSFFAILAAHLEGLSCSCSLSRAFQYTTYLLKYKTAVTKLTMNQTTTLLPTMIALFLI